MRKKFLLLGGAIAVAATGVFFYHQHAQRYPSTDNAYVGAGAVHVAPQVSGTIVRLLITNQQMVHKSDLLYAIERRPYELALEQTRAHLAEAQLEVAQNVAGVSSAEAAVHRAEVLLRNAREHADRSKTLHHTDLLSRQQADDDEAAYQAAQASLAVARAQLVEAQHKLGTPGNDNEAVRAARAAMEKAQWDLDHTEVHASCNGYIAELGLQPGDSVQVGQPGFALICNDRYWVDANFKETELDRIRVGQPVDVTVDMYPGHHFHGEVQSISGATGVAFSLLPPENATGNWVKVTQRVPVRVRITDPTPDLPLRVGTSAAITVDTTVKQ